MRVKHDFYAIKNSIPVELSGPIEKKNIAYQFHCATYG